MCEKANEVTGNNFSLYNKQGIASKTSEDQDTEHDHQS
jgi:hypothetical protein